MRQLILFWGRKPTLQGGSEQPRGRGPSREGGWGLTSPTSGAVGTAPRAHSPGPCSGLYMVMRCRLPCAGGPPPRYSEEPWLREVKRQSQALVLPCDHNLCSEGGQDHLLIHEGYMPVTLTLLPPETASHQRSRFWNPSRAKRHFLGGKQQQVK